MNNFVIYKCDDECYSEYYIVEIWNSCDLLSIQQQLTDSGYIIDRVVGEDRNHTFMKVRKPKSDFEA
jgi:hypothetical protein